MTKSQILAELTALLDYVNDTGKAKLEALARDLAALLPEEKPEPVVVPEPTAPPVPVDRRSDERDETSDQKLAEKLGLTK